MKKHILGTALLSSLLILPLSASAGSVITDLKVARPSPVDMYTAAWFLEANPDAVVASSSAPQDFRKAARGDDESDGPYKLTRYEISQLQQGLINEADLAQGCGGASVTAGPAGFLPLAVAGLALLRRKRRR